MNYDVPNVRIRGVRQKLPTGYIMGRINPGQGKAELIPVGTLGQRMIEAGIVAPGSVPGGPLNPEFEYLGFSATGLFSSDQRFTMAMSPKDVLFPSVLGVSQSAAIAGFAPVADYTFYLVQDYAAFLATGATVIASITFLAGHKTGTISWGSPVTLPAHTILYMMMAATPDATLAEVQVLFAGDAQ